MIQQVKKGRPAENLSGQKFGKLLVIRIDHIRSRSRYVYECLCGCGNKHLVQRSHLISGNTKSCGCLSKLPEGIAAFNNLFYHYKHDAKRRKHNFELSEQEFKNLTKSNCHYCGSTPSQKIFKSFNGEYVYNGIDRLDCNKGYTIDNCVSCCGRCNEMKMGDNYNEFLERITSIYRCRVERKDDTAS